MKDALLFISSDGRRKWYLDGVEASATDLAKYHLELAELYAAIAEAEQEVEAKKRKPSLTGLYVNGYETTALTSAELERRAA